MVDVMTTAVGEEAEAEAVIETVMMTAATDVATIAAHALTAMPLVTITTEIAVEEVTVGMTDLRVVLQWNRVAMAANRGLLVTLRRAAMKSVVATTKQAWVRVRCKQSKS